MVEDENSFFNQDIEAASGYSDSGDIGVFGFIEYYDNNLLPSFSPRSTSGIIKNKSVVIHTIKYKIARIPTNNCG